MTDAKGSGRSSDDEPVSPLQLIDAAMRHYASSQTISASEVLGTLRELRAAVVLDIALTSLREEFLGIPAPRLRT